MNSERNIVKKLFENKMKDEVELEEAGFEANGSKYSCAFGHYSKDGQPISREEYFRAKGEGVEGSSSTPSQKDDSILSKLDSASEFARGASPTIRKSVNYAKENLGADALVVHSFDEDTRKIRKQIEDYISTNKDSVKKVGEGDGVLLELPNGKQIVSAHTTSGQQLFFIPKDFSLDDTSK